MNYSAMIAVPAHLEAVFAAQRSTALGLRRSTAQARIATLKKLEAAVLAFRYQFYEALRADLRKPEAEADLAEIMPVISEIRHTIKHLRRWMKPRRVAPTMAMLGTQARIKYEPKGVSLIISPWNYPVGLTLGPLACAIGAGCTAIIKPSELAPATASVLAALIGQTFDPAEIALFEGDATVSKALLALPFDHIFFTGSPAVGKIVMTAAANHLSSVTLELGGKSPVIVHQTADVQKAADSIMWGKFLNAGQTCIAPDYLFVHETIRPAFLNAAKAAIIKMYGPDIPASPDYCRIVNERNFERVRALLNDAAARGARAETGGATTAAAKYIAPTLLTNVAMDSAVMQEEIFGPVLPILSYTDISDPIRQINAGPKPLAIYVYGKDAVAIDRILGETSSGGAAVNMAVLQFSHPNLPFGGVNNSGIGSSHGIFGFRAFSHERAVLADKFSTTKLLFPPYTVRVQRLIKLLVRYLT